MATYLYELPTTGAISFSDFCIDKTTSYTTWISNATQARANLRAALKESKHTDGERDYLKLVKVVDDYLPQLFGLKACLDEDEIVLSSQLLFSWRTTLSSNLFNTSPRQTVSSIYADVSFTILTYAFALSNLARTTVASLGNYERQRALPEAERKAKDDKLNFAVTLLCRASGAFKHIGDIVLPEWDKHESATFPRPPDVSQEVVNALSKMALADAQQLAIRKLLSKAVSDSTFTPGPPLPKSHPSPALIAKLYLECASLYASARALAKTPGASRPTIMHRNSDKDNHRHDSEEVAPELRHYLADAAQLCSALSHKWLGVDAGENGGSARGGEAVAFLAWAKSELEDLKDGRHGVILDKEKREKKERMKERVTEELASATTFLKHYKKMNDTLHFQPVPATSELQASIPSGRAAVEPRPYIVPIPAFGPGSVAYIQRQAEQLELKTKDSADPDPDRIEPPALEQNTSVSPSYAGAGSYF